MYRSGKHLLCNVNRGIYPPPIVKILINKSVMKKILLVLMGAFLFSGMSVIAQDVVEGDAKAEALQKQEDKKQSKGDKKANKKKSKAEKAAAKRDKKATRQAKAEAEYYEFLANYKPIEKTGYEQVDEFIDQCNTLFASLATTEQEIGYIEVVTHQEYDDFTEDTITVVDAVRSKITGEEVNRSDAAKAYTKASLTLTAATATTATLVLQSANVVMSSISDPMQAIALTARIKPIAKQLKVTGQVLPVIVKRVNENRDALNFKRNNLADEAAPVEETTDSVTIVAE